MTIYTICAVILISGLVAHLVSCYEMMKARKMIEGLMDDYAKELVDIAIVTFEQWRKPYE